MKRYITLIAFVIFVVGAGLIVGATNTPGEWYEGLTKPPFNPPNWVFAPVWTLLYVMIAIVGWRVWLRSDLQEAQWVWSMQMALNLLWSPVFFTLQSPGAALVIIAVLLAAILIFIRLVWRTERPSAYLFLPYAAWVAFASVLNLSIFLLN